MYIFFPIPSPFGKEYNILNEKFLRETFFPQIWTVENLSPEGNSPVIVLAANESSMEFPHI